MLSYRFRDDMPRFRLPPTGIEGPQTPRIWERERETDECDYCSDPVIGIGVERFDRLLHPICAEMSIWHMLEDIDELRRINVLDGRCAVVLVEMAERVLHSGNPQTIVPRLSS